MLSWNKTRYRIYSWWYIIGRCNYIRFIIFKIIKKQRKWIVRNYELMININEIFNSQLRLSYIFIYSFNREM
jgi:hypothetical protein